MGWEIMGTEHLKPKGTPTLTNQEQAERVIDFLENSGYPLLPWQAEALRALLTYPVATRFMVGAPRQHPQRNGIRADLGGQDDVRPGMVKVLRDGEWVWETPQPERLQQHYLRSHCECLLGAINPKCVVHGDERRY